MGKVIVEIPKTALLEVLSGKARITSVQVQAVGLEKDEFEFHESVIRIDSLQADISSNVLSMRIEVRGVPFPSQFDPRYPRGVITMQQTEQGRLDMLFGKQEKAENDS